MTDTRDDKRTSGRRKKERRISDLLHGSIPEEEIEALDALIWHKYLLKDRRSQKRRSGEDSREKNEP